MANFFPRVEQLSVKCASNTDLKGVEGVTTEVYLNKCLATCDPF